MNNFKNCKTRVFSDNESYFKFIHAHPEYEIKFLKLLDNSNKIRVYYSKKLGRPKKIQEDIGKEVNIKGKNRRKIWKRTILKNTIE